MKKKNQEIVFNLKFIDENSKDTRDDFPNVLKHVDPITPLDSFPICYFKDEKHVEKPIEETIVINEPNKFVSPIIGEQNNDLVSGEHSNRPKEVYEKFMGDEKKPQTISEIKKSFDLLDSKDYRNILINGVAPVDYDESTGYEYEIDDTYEEEVKEVEIPEVKHTNYEYYVEEDTKPKEENKFEDIEEFTLEDDLEEEVELEEEVIEKPIKKEVVIKEVEKPAYHKPSKRSKYVAPPLKFLKKNEGRVEVDNEWALEKQNAINRVFSEFNYGAKAVGYKVGPTVTLFLIDIEPGTDVGKINSFTKTLQMRLCVKSLRIHSPIPGMDCAGIEVPNAKRTTVLAGTLINNPEYLQDEKKLKFALGLNLSGDMVYADIEKMPHGLIAGATGSGKSVCINTMIISLIYHNTPDELRMIMVDPKMVELSIYNDIPHLAMPVITEAKKAAPAFKWLCEEMDRRFMIFSQYHVRDISKFNKLMEAQGNKIFPRIVLIIDELADLMLVAGNEIDGYIQRLGGKARAAGIHVILATQRPSTDVIKGTMKNNVPARIAFAVTSPVDSTTILDHGGAEKLLGMGDMLFSNAQGEERVQGALVTDDEISDIVEFLVEHNEVSFLLDSNQLQERIVSEEVEEGDDELLEEVALYMVRNKNGSSNIIQTKFGVSFNRAKRMLSKMEKLGILSETVAGKPREVLVNEEELLRILDENK
ncbi:MAG: DNA translocase FtsK [Bacilli bacterium]|nr:DNA translocase FtsK [Bacilli bacterium]